MIPTGLEVNVMQIKEMRLSFIQVECITAPLRSLQAPKIPFPFLLSGPLFQKQYLNNLILNSEPCFAPWLKKSYGKLFWTHYIRKNAVSTNEYWRALVPLQFRVALPGAMPPAKLSLRITAAWLKGKTRARIFLYPWGIGLIVDIDVLASMSLDEAVLLGQDIQRSRRFHVEIDGIERDPTLKELISMALQQVRTVVYGQGMAKGQTSELFSTVTVLDADSADPARAVEDGGEFHRALEGMAGWNPLFKSLRLDPLAKSTIDIKQSPPGHLLYGGHRGRVVWFPGNFRSVAKYKHTLSCYHQNLTVASLHTESLCRLTRDVADVMRNDQQLANVSVTYRECAKHASGILGRLYGGTFDTYRSHSIRHQIQHMYKEDVSSVRTHFGMTPLNE